MSESKLYQAARELYAEIKSKSFDSRYMIAMENMKLALASHEEDEGEEEIEKEISDFVTKTLAYMLLSPDQYRREQKRMLSEMKKIVMALCVKDFEMRGSTQPTTSEQAQQGEAKIPTYAWNLLRGYMKDEDAITVWNSLTNYYQTNFGIKSHILQGEGRQGREGRQGEEFDINHTLIGPTGQLKTESEEENLLRYFKRMKQSHIALTTDQKLNALAFKYYQGAKWEPKTGDYYTTSRNDLQLYQIVEANEMVVKTRYCDPSKGDSISEWSTENFLLDFGVNRVHVPHFILEPKSPTSGTFIQKED